jgi:hypothetical protein
MKQAIFVIGLEYKYSMYVRGDNDPVYAKYLGYLNASELYPDLVPRSFEAYAKELLNGKAVAAFQGMSFEPWLVMPNRSCQVGFAYENIQTKINMFS